jgi:hypothetical protein
MTQHKTEVCSVHNTRPLNFKLSSEQPNATSIELLGQHALFVAHINVNMNLDIRR